MNALFESAKEIQDFMSGRGWKFCIIGGLALQRWGEPRQTNDVDLTLLTGFGGEEEYIQAILQQYKARIQKAHEFALKNRVLMLRMPNGIPVDVSLGAIPYEKRIIKRATFFDFAPGIRLLTCSAEDLVILKAFAERAQDWIDVENIKTRQGPKLNWKLILTEIKPLAAAKEASEIVNKLLKMARK
jgi:predicted nucleotidyltransferase